MGVVSDIQLNRENLYILDSFSAEYANVFRCYIAKMQIVDEVKFESSIAV